MTAGQSFVKAIKPLGCVLFLILFAVFMVFCFTSKAPLGVRRQRSITQSILTSSSRSLKQIFFRLLTALRTAAGAETK